MSAQHTLRANEKLWPVLDKALVQKSVTGFLIDNGMRAQFVGSRSVLITDMDFTGLGDYDRVEGFTPGTITMTDTPHVLTMDRAASFEADRESVDETGIDNFMGQASGDFLRRKVVPEVDAYTLSKIAKVASDRAQTVTGTPATGAFKMLQEAISYAQDATAYDEELVAFVDSTMDLALCSSSDITRQLTVSDFKKGDVNTKVKSYNGVAILPTSKDRMMTEYLFNDGTSSGQEAGGFTPTAEAKKIGLIVMPKRAAMLVKKTAKLRMFSPDTNQLKDAWKMDYRLYYDAFIRKSMMGGIFTYIY